MSEPQWLIDWKLNPASKLPAKGFAPGQSGCPTGRPPGIIDKRKRITQMLGDDAEHVVRKALELAKAGDPVALPLVISRVAPALKPVDEPAPFALDTSQDLEAQGLSILKAIADGALTPQQGKSLMELVHGLAALRDVDTLAKRLDALEAEVREGRATSAPGSVQQTGNPA